jgi:rhomboid family GlyGly-CTERM serine protease
VRSSADRPHGGSAAWLAVAALLLLPALALFGQALGPRQLAWEPSLWMAEPWRWWSAAWIHLSPLHLGANGAGAVLVASLGVAARVPQRAALAWALAWPATQLGLLAMPDITGYGGLSGVLHAGVAVVAVVLVRRTGRGERRVGLAIAAVLTLKLLIEAPWRAAVTHPVGWDIAVAPLAHASGALAGAGLAWLLCRPVTRTGQNLPPTRSPADR